MTIITKTTTSVIILTLLLGATIPHNFQPAHAATGDPVATTNFSVACSSGVGVGIAFDGTNLWYSCYASHTDLYRANPTTGVVDQNYTIQGGLGALAYDSVNNVIYAGPGGGSSSCDVLAIQLDASKSVVGTTTKFTNPSVCTALDDGLAYDGTNNSFYYSPDGSTTITHFDATGNIMAGSPFTWTGTGCYNSGLAIGGNLLFQGSDGCNHIWVVDKTSLAAAYDFGTGAGGVRDEDLECDTATFAGIGKQVMWSMEAYEPRRAVAFEIAPGTCGTGGQPAITTGNMTGGGSITDTIGTPSTRVTHGFELQCNATQTPNNLEVNWAKGKFHLENLTSASCTDDPKITPNPPAAGFNTYTGKGTGKLNGVSGATIEFTFTDAGEPGNHDTAKIVIKTGSTTVLSVSGNLNTGNQQAHK